MASGAVEIEPKKEIVSDPDFHPGRSETMDHGAIATRAYELWQARGCPIGSSQEDWFRAEQELKDRVASIAPAL
jgi:Protein of unknown function (DUF2934)